MDLASRGFRQCLAQRKDFVIQRCWFVVLIHGVNRGEENPSDAVLYFLFMGFALDNVGVLPVESDLFIREFAELGIIFIMFSLGFEETTKNFMASMRKSCGIALFGAIGPFSIA